jgi:hypothetical protein
MCMVLRNWMYCREIYCNSAAKSKPGVKDEEPPFDARRGPIICTQTLICITNVLLVKAVKDSHAAGSMLPETKCLKDMLIKILDECQPAAGLWRHSSNNNDVNGWLDRVVLLHQQNDSVFALFSKTKKRKIVHEELCNNI